MLFSGVKVGCLQGRYTSLNFTDDSFELSLRIRSFEFKFFKKDVSMPKHGKIKQNSNTLEH